MWICKYVRGPKPSKRVRACRLGLDLDSRLVTKAGSGWRSVLDDVWVQSKRFYSYMRLWFLPFLPFAFCLSPPTGADNDRVISGGKFQWVSQGPQELACLLRSYLCSCLLKSWSSRGCAADAARKHAPLSARIISLTEQAASHNCHKELPHFSRAFLLPVTLRNTARTSLDGPDV